MNLEKRKRREHTPEASEAAFTSKRRRQLAPDDSIVVHTWLGRHDLDEDDFWATAALYSLSDEVISTGEGLLEDEERGLNGGSVLVQTLNGADDLLADLFPDFAPSVPSLEERFVDLAVPNPFAVDGLAEHPRVTSQLEPVVIPTDGAINGLVKFRLRFEDRHVLEHQRTPLAFQKGSYTMQTTKGLVTKSRTTIDVPYLPPDFGRGLNLDQTDTKLLKFYLVAFCPGRTLLPASNVWLSSVPAIAQKSECVKHALLSLAAGYVLDYAPSEKLMKRANHHHKKAALLLGLELNKQENYEPGKEEPLLVALSLMNHEDIVNWETHDAFKAMPKWYRGVRAVKQLLDKSDPGYRYQKPANVQSTSTRYIMSNYQAQSYILSQTSSPLDFETEDCPFPWLLEGSEKEVKRILGLTGCCPKLLHMYAQITHLVACLEKNPASVAIPSAAKIILERLHNFRQWSDMSEGYESPQKLFDSCVLDESGKVVDAAMSVALNAESYVASAQIYLHCRLLRRPRKHPEVQAALNNLMRCIDLVPLDGPLYTAQDSLLGPAIAGYVAIREGHRDIIREQFESLLDGPRGNDTPVWRTLEDLWPWLDTELEEDDVDDGRPISESTPWWETMVDRIMEKEGRLSLI